MVPHLIYCFLILLLSATLPAHAQEVISWENPSLEGNTGAAKVPQGWYFCGSRKGDAPDVHPADLFRVLKTPRDGKSYVGLVLRPSGKRTIIGQRLERPLQKGQCYEWSLFAARSSDYLARLSTTKEPINFNQPLRLLVFGSDQACEGGELLAESTLIQYPDWSLVRFQLKPSRQIEHIWLTVEGEEDQSSLAGNILIDDLSALLPVDCGSRESLIRPDTITPVPIGSQDKWRAYVKKKAECVEFDENSARLTMKPYFWQDSQRLLYGSAAVHSLALALTYFPDQVLEISIKGETRRLRKGRKQAILALWKKLGFSRNQLSVSSQKGKKSSGWAENEWINAWLR